MTQETDIIIIGSGIGGLSGAALLARYGFQVTVCEAHTIPGGAAHGFQRQGYLFDSGPSLFSGLSAPSPNPLRQVLDAIGEEVPCVQYDTWGCWLPEGNFDTAVGADQFCEVLWQLREENAVTEWQKLQEMMVPLGKAATALSPLAVRSDWGILRTIAPFLPTLGKNSGQMFQKIPHFLMIWISSIIKAVNGPASIKPHQSISYFVVFGNAHPNESKNCVF